MEFSFACRHVDVPEELRTVVREKVSRLSRHLDGWDTAEVHFTEERNPRIADREICEITLRGSGHVARAKASAPEMLAAVDRVVDKLEHQVDKLKTRLQRRSHGRRVNGPGEAPTLVEQEAPDDDDGPRFVKSKRFEIKPMTPEEAALQMDLLGHDFFFFTNADTGVAAVVYRRGDGDLGLIDGA